MKTDSILLTLIILIVLGLSSCNDDKQPITIELETSSIEFDTHIANEKSIFILTNAESIDITVPPKDAEWCQASLTNRLIKIKVTENQSTSNNRSTTIIVSAKGATPAEIKVTQAARLQVDENELKTFIISAKKNNLKNDIKGIINSENKTVRISSNEWIENIKGLIVDFNTEGEVWINDTKQISGETKVSFLDDLIYTVKAKDGSSNDYEIITTGPMFTGLPIVSIFIDGNKEVVEKKTKLPASFNLTTPTETDFEMSNVEMTIRGRGNSTWGMSKKPYRVDFPSKTSLFGLPKAKKWVFLANYQDPTFLMNDIAFELGRRFELEFNHSSIHVEMFVNGTYRGNYQMTEQKETGEGRVDINTDGGFLVELDEYFDEDFKFKSKYFNLPVMVQSPKLKSDNEMDYIKEAFHAFENTLFGDNFPSNDYEEYTDVESLINFILINEIVQNPELHWPKSTYLYKEADSKIKWGPLWDFDWAFGYNGSNRYFTSNSLLFYEGGDRGGNYNGSGLFCRFFEIPNFRTQYYARWKEVKPIVQDIIKYIDEKAKYLDKSQAENFKLQEATPNTKNTSYEELINQMKSWLEDRIDFLDNKLKE